MPQRQPRGQGNGRASLGLGKYLGGASVEDGSFEELPSVEVQRPQGPTLTGESLPPEFKFSAGKYKAAKPKSGFMDFLSGGEGSRAASAQNANAQLTMQQIAAAQAIQQVQTEAEFARTGMQNSGRLQEQQLQNEGQLANTRLGGRFGLMQNNQASRNRIHEGDAGMLNKSGLPSSALGEYSNRVVPHMITRAEVESANAEGFAQSPQGYGSQEANYNAVLRAPQAENYAKTRTAIQPNEQMFIPSLNGEMSGTMLHGNTTGEQVVSTPKILTLPDGKVMSAGSEVNTIKTTQPGGAPSAVISPEERQRRERERMRQIQAAQQFGASKASTPPMDLNALVQYLQQR